MFITSFRLTDFFNKAVQQVLDYRDKGVQKFQKIPIIEFSGSLQSTYKPQILGFSRKNHGNRIFPGTNQGNFYSIVTIKNFRYCEDPNKRIPDIQGLAVLGNSNCMKPLIKFMRRIRLHAMEQLSIFLLHFQDFI